MKREPVVEHTTCIDVRRATNGECELAALELMAAAAKLLREAEDSAMSAELDRLLANAPKISWMLDIEELRRSTDPEYVHAVALQAAGRETWPPFKGEAT